MTKIFFLNGAQAIVNGGHYTYIKYNTGDQVWFDYNYFTGKNEVINAITYDGIDWNERFSKTMTWKTKGLISIITIMAGLVGVLFGTWAIIHHLAGLTAVASYLLMMLIWFGFIRAIFKWNE